MKRISTFFHHTVSGLLLVSCIHIERSPESGYSNEGTRPENPITNWAARSVRQNLEANLRTKEEIELYSQVSPWFWTEDEAIEFLTQPNAVQKRQWIQTKGIARRPTSLQPKVQKALDAEDIVIGMPQDTVLQSWGD
ncbi:MAG: hypothetical protein AB7O96_14465, partial [Pseudobdellovibrionaceae bacterium]